MTDVKNKEFELGGVHHLALVCSDMERTVDFYSNVLGMPLTMTLDLGRLGQHFFFDMGGGDSLAFMWYPEGPPAVPGVTITQLPDSYYQPKNDIVAKAAEGDKEGSRSAAMASITAVGSMSHLAFTVPVEKIDEYRDRLVSKGLAVTDVWNHTNTGLAPEMNDEVFCRSLYFKDPDGMLLEFSCWTRELDDNDLGIAPATLADKAEYGLTSTSAG